jgi:signal recognition particle subunit SRP54
VTQTFLVADAMTGQEAVNVGAAFQSAVGVDGVILTKLDGDARGGAALSFRHATGQQIRFAGVGEKPTDLEVFHADRMASRILGMGDVLSLIEKAESSVDKEQAKEVERHLRSGQLTFDDFLLQIRQLRSMGSVAGVMEMLPGGMLPAGASDVDAEAEVKKMESIILSMTPRERAHPEILDGSRRRRVARGSGTEVADVNRLLKQREMIQKLFKQFGLGGAPGRRPVLPGLGRKLFG